MRFVFPSDSNLQGFLHDLGSDLRDHIECDDEERAVVIHPDTDQNMAEVIAGEAESWGADEEDADDEEGGGETAEA